MMSQEELSNIIRESTDMHFHIGPDVLPRKYCVESLIKEEQGNIRRIVLKSHAFPTAPMIKQALSSHEKNNNEVSLRLIGSVTLNRFVGGLNPDAIYSSHVLSKERVVVWLPTIHAKNHLSKTKGDYEIPAAWSHNPNFVCRKKEQVKPVRVMDKDKGLTQKMIQVLKAIKRFDCVLATGHVSHHEAKMIAEQALKMNIPVILTHVAGRHIAMPINMQKDLAEKGAFVEHCYIFYKDRLNPEDYPLSETARMIKEVGADHVIVSSDSGQTKNPLPSECLKHYVGLLSKFGITKEDWQKILIKNPKRLLG